MGASGAAAGCGAAAGGAAGAADDDDPEASEGRSAIINKFGKDRSVISNLSGELFELRRLRLESMAGGLLSEERAPEALVLGNTCGMLLFICGFFIVPEKKYRSARI
jgi:hypothetical protein